MASASASEDLADRLDDLICTFENAVGPEYDTVAMVIGAWIVIGGIVFTITHLLSTPTKRQEKDKTPPQAEEVPELETINTVEAASPSVQLPPITPPLTSSPSSKPRLRPDPVVVPQTAGSDPDAARWVDGLFERIFNKKGGDRATVLSLLRLWKDALTEYNKLSGADVSAH